MKKIVFACFVLLILLFSGCAQPQDNSGNANGGDILADNSQIVEKGDTIKVEYKGTFETGEEFDSSARSGTPLEFVAGAGRMIKGFDAAVIGMKLNGEKTVTLAPEEAYGQPDPSRIVEIKKENIPDFNSLEIGMTVSSPQAGNGIVTALDENSATVDFNGKLAGKTLVFWIKVVGIQKA